MYKIVREIEIVRKCSVKERERQRESVVREREREKRQEEEGVIMTRNGTRDETS